MLRKPIKIHGQAHKILVRIAYSQKPSLNTHVDVSSLARGLIYLLSLQLYPYFVYASNGDSGESAHMRRLDLVFAARRCHEYQNLVGWPSVTMYIYYWHLSKHICTSNYC